ncbi:MAG: U32 family peptidase [Lachnospiraceae bacterium]|nr:U32 family peptidase [Lachnospiraceae bacterium]
MELLSPAGNYNAFIGALNAGCDAVYLGGSRFGARAYADNFSDEEIIKAIKLAHINNVKVYLTVNTLIKEREYSDVIDYLRPLYEAGLDGCIVQDLGLIVRFRELFPDMECHVSTQGFATGIESVKFYKSLGASRVVLARELSLDEIKKIKASVDVELETFIHGAMCYSYSGECLFSSCLGGRSGNRGRCAGPCRLPYKMLDDKSGADKYLLSMKDQCTVDIIPELINAGIDSLKIEGRMKKPEYSAFVTSVYRKYIDLFMEHPDAYKVDKKDFEDLRHMYLRSEIGKGYYHVQNGREMITLESPAYNGNDDALMKRVSEQFLSGIKKQSITMYTSLIPGRNASLTVIQGEVSVTVEGDEVSTPLNRPLAEADIIKQLSKLGDTAFSAEEVYVEMPEPAFMPVKSLNELRRSAIEQLKDELSVKEPAKISPITFKGHKSSHSFVKKPIVMVHTKEQYDAACAFDDIYIGVPAELLLKEKISGNNIIAVLPDVIRIKDYGYVKEFLKHICNNNCCAVYVRNFEALNIIAEGNYDLNVVVGSEIYTANKSAVEFIDDISDVHAAPLELSKHELAECYNDNTYVFAYGKLPLMHTANCVLKTSKGCEKHKGNPFVYFKDRTDTVFSAYRNCDICSNIIYNSVPTFLYEELKESRFSMERIILSFTDENASETRNILSLYINGAGEYPDKFTKAYWKRGVE